MTLRYEANPPKITPDNTYVKNLDRFVERLALVSDKCDGIHITENVLGFSRVSPILAGHYLCRAVPDVLMTLTIRVRDKSVSDIDEFVQKAIGEKFSGILVVAGDSAPNLPDSGQIPSSVIRHLRKNNINEKLKLYLSMPANPNYTKMTSKIRARPHGFMTQVIQNGSQVKDMIANLADFDIIPIVLYPSPKNQKAASFLNIDMSQYMDDFASFVDQIHEMTGDVLLTSPGDHAGLYEFLSSHRY